MGEEQGDSTSVVTTRKRRPSALQFLGRWLLSLWWTFVLALGASALAQSLGTRGGPLAITEIPQAIAYLQHAPSWMQIGAGLLTLAILVIAGVLTWMAFENRATQAEEEAQTVVDDQKYALGQAIDERRIVPQLTELSEESQRIGEQAGEIHDVVVATKAKTDTAVTVATEARDIVRQIAERQNRHNQLSAGVTLTLVRDLQRETFKLGDNSAANFPYIYEPVAATFDAATNALSAGASQRKVKSGILVLGEANAGKTRLALEALKEALPDWEALRWSEARQTVDIPPVEAFAGRKVALFVDDVQNYAGAVSQSGESSAQAISTAGAALRTLWETLRCHASATVLVATCRSEDEARARASLGWLFDELHRVAIPSFSARVDSSEAATIIREFGTHGVVLTGAWDGTLGSLVLGLQRKHDEYEALKQTNDSATQVLRAMKLLTIAGIFGHTYPRIRHVCADILGYSVLLIDGARWNGAVDDLLRLQFISEEATTSGEPALVIRKDSYFDAVVTDYPNPQRPQQLLDQRRGLRNVLADLRDTYGLVALGTGWSETGDQMQALSAYDEALALNPDLTQAWSNKGASLVNLERYEEALAACERALALDPDLAQAWGNKAAALAGLRRFGEALDASRKALTLNPRLATAWSNIAAALVGFGRYEEAVEASEQALELNPHLATAWSNKAVALAELERYEEAVEASEQALKLDSHLAHAWTNRAAALAGLNSAPPSRRRGWYARLFGR